MASAVTVIAGPARLFSCNEYPMMSPERVPVAEKLQVELLKDILAPVTVN